MSVFQQDLDEIHNLQDENQRLELQISMLERDNRGQRKNGKFITNNEVTFLSSFQAYM